MANEDILSAATAATQQMTPPQRDFTTFGPTPLVQPSPMPRFTPQQPQFAKAGNEFQTVSGRKRADRQATISGVANFIKSGGDYIQAKKQRELSGTIERLMSAQAGLEEAKAANNQEGIQKNTAIINDITSDPKKVKQLQKAFNIDLFGTGKNQNENKALMEAWKNYSAEKNKNPAALNPTAQRLQASQPWRQGLSPEAQAQAMAIKAGLVPKAGEILSAYQSNYKTLMAAKDVDSRNAALERIAANKNDLEVYKIGKLGDELDKKLMNAHDIAEIRERTEKYKASTVAATWDKRIDMMRNIAVTTKNPMVKELSTQADTYNKQLKTLADENKALQIELDKPSSGIGKYFGGKAIDPASASSNRIKISTNNMRMRALQSQLDGVTQKMQTLQSMGLLHMENLSSGSSGGGNDDQIVVPDSDVPGTADTPEAAGDN